MITLERYILRGATIVDSFSKSTQMEMLRLSVENDCYWVVYRRPCLFPSPAGYPYVAEIFKEEEKRFQVASGRIDIDPEKSVLDAIEQYKGRRGEYDA